MHSDDIEFLRSIGLQWPPPEQVVADLALPADLDDRITESDG